MGPTWTAPVLALLAAALLVGGCAGGTSDDSGPEHVRGTLATESADHDVSRAEDRVGRDADATPAQIFTVGSPDTMSVRPDGSLITTYVAVSDSEGEGPSQQAWRVYDAGGHRVAQGREAITQAVSDGFLVADGSFDDLGRVRHVDPDGTVTDVRTSRTRSYPRRGDTLIDALASFYRPSAARLFTSPRSTRVQQTGIAGGKNAALSDTGVLYLTADPATAPLPVAATADTGRTWRTTEVPVGRSKPSAIAAHGDTAAIALSRTSIDGGPLAGVAVTHDAGRTWSRSASGLPLGKYVDHLGVGADGRVLLGAFGTGWWRSRSATSTAYAPVPLPPGGVSDVQASRDRLWALSNSAVWSSTDDGRSWTSLETT